MKRFSALLALLICFSSQAQNLVVSYSFNEGMAKDISGNGYDGTLVGSAAIVCDDHCAVKVGYGTGSYMTVPAEILNGLNDFTIEIHFSICNFSTTSYSAANTILSASNASCFNCLGIAYDKNALSWKLTINGTTSTFMDSMVHTGNEGEFIKVSRSKGNIFFYHGTQLVGMLTDYTTLNVTSIVLGQQQHCEGGCFECGQTMRGSIDLMKVYDYDVKDETGTDMMTATSSIHVFPNPANTTLHVTSLQHYANIVVMDYAGKVIYSTPYQEEIGITNLPAGVYFVQLRTSDDVASERVKFVKQQ